MSNVFDRLAQGPQGGQQGQPYDNWNEMVGAAPREHVYGAAAQAVSQIDPQDYYNHTQPGIGGTDPFGALGQGQRAGLAQSLLGALLGRGLGQSQIGQQAGLSNLDPSRMSPQDLAALAQYAQRQHPEALADAASQHQQDPGLLESLLGNKALLMMAAGLGAKYLADRNNQQQQAAPQQQGVIRRRGETSQF